MSPKHFVSMECSELAVGELYPNFEELRLKSTSDCFRFMSIDLDNICMSTPANILQNLTTGSSGFANHIDALMEVAEYFEKQIQERPDFILVSPRQYMNVCFWYLPRYLQGKHDILEHSAQLHKVAPQIKSVMVKHGSVMLGYQPLKGLPNFFRFVSQNSALNKNDVEYILDLISEIGSAIFK